MTCSTKATVAGKMGAELLEASKAKMRSVLVLRKQVGDCVGVDVFGAHIGWMICFLIAEGITERLSVNRLFAEASPCKQISEMLGGGNGADTPVPNVTFVRLAAGRDREYQLDVRTFPTGATPVHPVVLVEKKVQGEFTRVE